MSKSSAVKGRLDAAGRERLVGQKKQGQGLRMRNDWLIVEHDRSEKVTKGGIITAQGPTSKKVAWRYGWVRGLGLNDLFLEGPKAGERAKWDLEEGDYILFLPENEHVQQHDDVEHKGVMCLLVPESACVAVVEEWVAP